MHKKKLIITAFVFILLPSFTAAQLVNIEKQRKDLKPGLSGAVGLSFKLNSNTTKIYRANLTSDLQWVKGQNLFLILTDLTSMRIATTDSTYDLINKNFEHFRYNYIFKNYDFLTAEAFVQHQQNKIKYLKLRFLTGGGLRFRIINSTAVTYYFAPLFMYEYEILSDSAATFTRTLKGDIYHSLYIKLGKLFYLSEVAYFQPALIPLEGSKKFEPFKDFRLSSETSLSFILIKNKLELSTNFNLSYDSNPPAELVNTPLFYSLTNKLRVRF